MICVEVTLVSISKVVLAGEAPVAEWGVSWHDNSPEMKIKFPFLLGFKTDQFLLLYPMAS